MKSKIIYIIVITTAIFVGFLVFRFAPMGWQTKLISPHLTVVPSPSPLPSPSPTPKTFKFDSSTDLKAELEKVNPQVLDSDFNE